MAALCGRPQGGRPIERIPPETMGKLLYAAALAVYENMNFTHAGRAAHGFDFHVYESGWTEDVNVQLNAAVRLRDFRNLGVGDAVDEDASGAIGTTGFTVPRGDAGEIPLTFLRALPKAAEALTREGSHPVYHKRYALSTLLFNLWEFVEGVSRDPRARQVSSQTLSLLAFSRALHSVVARSYDRMEAQRLGLLKTTWDHLKELLEAGLADLPVTLAGLDGAGAISALRSLDSPADGFSGPVLLPMSNDHVLVDLYSVPRQLENVTGSLMSEEYRQENTRAQHFELAIQRAIDKSKWVAPVQIQGYARRTLKCNGEDITDIDAIGFKDGVLLAIDAKSFREKPAYIAAKHRALANMSEKVEEARVDWAEKMTKIQENPEGTNYDFRGATQFLGVVCTPNPCFALLPGAAASVVPGLLGVSSFEELLHWISDDGVTWTPGRSMARAASQESDLPVLPADW